MKKSILLGVLAVAMVFGVVGLASADIVTYSAPATGTVTAKATVAPKITLTIDTPDAAQTVDFGTVDPATAYSGTVGLEVKSNKVYDLTVGAPAGDVALLGFTKTLASATGEAKTASKAYTDTYGINVPFTTDPGAYAVTVQYTVAQQ
ncbi:MAG: hypothetical protein Q8K89_09270 [Actinomycetota bacterium]|nr:hypothetical protein [Actinomycetota bacterium]